MNIIDIWKMCPSVTYATLDHHLGHITAAVMVFLILVTYFKVNDLIATLATYSLAFFVEMFSVLYYQETVRNALNDLVQYSFVVVAFLLLRKLWLAAGITAAGLLGLYFLLTLRIL